MIQRAILCTTLLMGWSCSCDQAVVCNETADCEKGSVCLEGLCLAACNNDCDCPDAYACGPVGACIPGTSQCESGQPPLCDGADLSSDPSNCGSCGRQCAYPNAIGQCTERECSLARCKPGFYNIDQRSGNGCEYSCTINILAPDETCDGRDNNCDGQVDEGLELTWYRDLDRDGVGTQDIAVLACLRPEGFVSAYGDCDDNDPNRYPGNTDGCDSQDNDCDGEVDEDALRPYFVDNDRDGFGNPNLSTIRCAPAAGEVELGTDCDDDDSERYPGKLEVCDGIDNNCDSGLTDEPYLSFYLDQDGDGFGRTDTVEKSCRRPDNYALDPGDCNDASDEDHPNALERCDGLDNNCNDQIDEGLELEQLFTDLDGDGYGAVGAQMSQACLGTPNLGVGQEDCDDSDAERYPGAPEWCDGVDQNCDQIVDNNLSIRSEAATTLGPVSGNVSQMCVDAAELRWLDQVPGAPAATNMKRSFDAQTAEEMQNHGDATPFSLNNYGESAALLGSSLGRCQLSVNGAAWQVISPANCRPVAVCTPSEDGVQNHWEVILAISESGTETASLYELDHLGQLQLVSTLASGELVTQAACLSDRFVAIAVEQNNRDVLSTGPAPGSPLRDYNNRLIGIDLIEVTQGPVLMALTRSDGVVEVESLSAQGVSQARQIAVGAPKVAGTARLVSAPSGGVLIYPVLEPAFERGVWATPLAGDGSANGSQQRINQDVISQNTTAILESQTAGMAQFYYVGADGVRGIFLGCAPP